jgi:2-polyprenyl-3-methyl-5-hydroxy-6-metoxy-1,4-benzoquinol methylase
MTFAIAPDVERRARQSLGSSHAAIYQMVGDALAARGVSGGRLVDVGCGGGGLWRVLGSRFDAYRGIDAVRYDGFPRDLEFCRADLDAPEWPVPSGDADVVAAVETIEHLENPWAFMRALVRLAKPGGWVVVTTPNQLSALSLVTLIVKRRFSAFQDAQYPAHRTALLESDLVRLGGASGLLDLELRYSLHGRLPLSPWHAPRAAAALAPRRLSDNLLLIGRRHADAPPRAD